LFSWDIHTETFAEGPFRDKIFDTSIVAALGRALGGTDSYIRSCMVDLFTAAMAQGALHCFYGVFIPKHSQRSGGTRFLTLT